MAQIRASAVLSFPSPSLRADRRHRLAVSFQDFGIFGRDHSFQFYLSYQKVFEIRWDELILRARGVFAGGSGNRWWDEADVGSAAFPVAPAGFAYAGQIGQGGVEYRLSLHREFFKVGLFADGSVHRIVLPRSALTGAIGYAGVFGVSVHFLVLDHFQFSAYWGGVVDQKPAFSNGAGFSLRKVY
jgi:hypothetical protein